MDEEMLIQEIWDSCYTTAEGHLHWPYAHGGSSKAAMVRYEGKIQPVVRVLWKALDRPLPFGRKHVLGRLCDDPQCCNPDHYRVILRHWIIEQWQFAPEKLERLLPYVGYKGSNVPEAPKTGHDNTNHKTEGVDNGIEDTVPF